jgi:glycosyltransferase involved in cell wall biosynthesis
LTASRDDPGKKLARWRRPMRMMIITPSFPPILNPESLVVGKLAKALVAEGVDLTVVTEDIRTLGEPPDDSASWRDGLGEVVRLLPPWYSKKASSLIAKVRRLDRNASWFSRAAIAFCAQRLRSQPYDWIMSRAPHGDAMYAAAHLRNRFPVRWIASLSDPHPQFYLPPPYSLGHPTTLIERRQSAWTRQALLAADCVVFPSLRLQRYMERVLDLPLGARGLVSPHVGWGRRDPGPRAERFEILHAGGLGLTRLSREFFSAFLDLLVRYPRARARVRVTLLGHVHEELRGLLQERDSTGIVRIVPPVSFDEAQQRMASADALLLLEGVLAEGIFLPSKFCDYAVAGSPLLMYSPEDGVISDLVGGFHHPGFLGQKPENFPRVIERLFQRLETNEPLDDYVYPRPGEFEGAAVARGLLAALGGAGK